MTHQEKGRILDEKLARHREKMLAFHARWGADFETFKRIDAGTLECVSELRDAYRLWSGLRFVCGLDIDLDPMMIQWLTFEDAEAALAGQDHLPVFDAVMRHLH